MERSDQEPSPQIKDGTDASGRKWTVKQPKVMEVWWKMLLSGFQFKGDFWVNLWPFIFQGGYKFHLLYTLEINADAG